MKAIFRHWKSLATVFGCLLCICLGYYVGGLTCRIWWRQDAKFDDFISHYVAKAAYAGDDAAQARSLIEKHLEFLERSKQSDPLQHVHSMEVAVFLTMKATTMSPSLEAGDRSDILRRAQDACYLAAALACSPRELLEYLKQLYPDNAWLRDEPELTSPGEQGGTPRILESLQRKH